jgi:hypothetical protein
MTEAAGPSGASLGFALVCVIALLASGWWTNWRYRRFDQLPAHYDLNGRPTRFESRRVMAWLVPALFSALVAGFVGLVMVVPPEAQNGDPSMALYIVPAVLLASQGLVLLLLHRWASGQRGF